MADQIAVEVAYALPQRQSLLSLTVAVDSTVQQVIEYSGILKTHPEIDLSKNKVGIWSRTVKLDERVRAGDRIEIYRPLIADPKDMRRRRAEKAKEEGRADKTTGGRPQQHHQDD
ncbi:RnfH family protein [Rheinheimera sp. 4Y26]|uniref:RnfH family protein n=1 Tax=Rheinheimera sp. 4Y26 TaxID=2977811 RepID=UPI0021B0A331|nr:RnfH family protein [Rheinheimera sp. 4Y26]MCT6700935.1 RnfH family protein [Rheinheimera sp. 4Y26]